MAGRTDWPHYGVLHAALFDAVKAAFESQTDTPVEFVSRYLLDQQQDRLLPQPRHVAHPRASQPSHDALVLGRVGTVELRARRVHGRVM